MECQYFEYSRLADFIQYFISYQKIKSQSLMAFMSEFKYEGIHSLIAFDLSRSRQIKQNILTPDKTTNSSSVRSGQKLAFRPYLP